MTLTRHFLSASLSFLISKAAWSLLCAGWCQDRGRSQLTRGHGLDWQLLPLARELTACFLRGSAQDRGFGTLPSLAPED